MKALDKYCGEEQKTLNNYFYFMVPDSLHFAFPRIMWYTPHNEPEAGGIHSPVTDRRGMVHWLRSQALSVHPAQPLPRWAAWAHTQPIVPYLPH